MMNGLPYERVNSRVAVCVHHREEFLRLYPSDRGRWSSAETQQYEQDALIAQRYGSTDVLDDRKMKTLFIVDGPGTRGFASNSGHHPDFTTGRYYR